MRQSSLAVLLVACVASNAHARDGLDLTSIFGSTPEGGLIAPSDPCFNDFISPVTNPVFFEDPRTLTEARLIFANHRIPTALAGGDAQLYALQLRAALTDRLSLIATKDGFMVTDNPLLNDGWADVAAGLKYNLFKDPQAQQLLSVGFTFEFPIGSTRTFQGNGDGEFNIFATGGMEFLQNWHYLTTTGFRLPVDRSDENQIWYWSNHIDFNIPGTKLYLLGETNWYHWLSSANAFPLPVQGLDIFNLGATGIGGDDIVTGAIGFRYKPTDTIETGIAWEAPMTDLEGLMKDRLTFDVIVRY